MTVSVGEGLARDPVAGTRGIRQGSAGWLGSVGEGSAAPPLRQLLDQLVDAVPALRQLRAGRRLRRRMRTALGYEPNLQHPRSFNEKIGWRILHDRNPLIPLTIDKIGARDWVSARVGPDILIPLLGTWKRAEDIDWETLPQRFVLKASHGWSMNLLVHDKRTIDREAAMATASGWLGRSHYASTDEWGYRDVPPRLLAEEMLLDAGGCIPDDLKFHVFDGRVRLIGVHNDRFGLHRVTFFDEQLRRLPVTQGCPANPLLQPPPGVAKLIPIAEQLGAPFDYVRVDLYLVEGRARFGELTHYDSGGCSAYHPPGYDRLIGDLWQLRATAPLAGARRAG